MGGPAFISHGMRARCARGYQQGGADGIYPNNGGPSSLEGYYADGVSITHGANPRQHVWTFIGQRGTDSLWVLATINVTDSIELRVCSSDQRVSDEVTAIDQIEQ